MAQEIYENDSNIRKFVDYCTGRGLMPIFELVSPFNQIVLPYKETKLVLLQVRNNETGEYYIGDNFYAPGNLAVSFGIPYAEHFSGYTLDDLLAKKETDKGIEGWVIMFEDGQMAKIKTNEYLSLHGILTDGLKEHLLVATIINEEVDDLLAQLEPGEKRDFVEDITNKVTHHFNHLVVAYKELRRKYFQDFNEDRKEFAIKHSKEPLFSGVMKGLNASFRDVEGVAEKYVKEYILNQCKTYEKARDYIGNLN